jgi:hypothetical protein
MGASRARQGTSLVLPSPSTLVFKVGAHRLTGVHFWAVSALVWVSCLGFFSLEKDKKKERHLGFSQFLIKFSRASSRVNWLKMDKTIHF